MRIFQPGMNETGHHMPDPWPFRVPRRRTPPLVQPHPDDDQIPKERPDATSHEPDVAQNPSPTEDNRQPRP